jgi:hypothetical protein
MRRVSRRMTAVSPTAPSRQKPCLRGAPDIVLDVARSAPDEERPEVVDCADDGCSAASLRQNRT